MFQALLDPSPKGWSSAIGEVPPLFIETVALAKERLEGEREPDLIPFRRWQLERAEADLAWQTEHAKEERGE